MEISEIISASFKWDQEIKYSVNISDDLSILESFNEQELLDVHNNTLNKISGEISSIFNSDEEDNIKIEKFASIIDLGVLYFNKSIEENNIKFLLIFFILNKFSHLFINEFLDNNKINNEEVLEATTLVFKFLNNLDLNMYAPNSSVFNEVINLNFSNDDLNKVKEIKNNIKNNYVNFSLEVIMLLVDFIKEYDFSLFMDLFLNSKSIQKVFLLIYNLTDYEVITLAKNEGLVNKWMIYAVIDKLNTCESNQENIQLMSNLINKSYNLDFDFFNQIVNEFNYKELFNYSLGYFLSKLNNEDIEHILINCFEIRIGSYSECKRKLLDEFSENVDEDKLSFFLKVFYKKWCLFIKNNMNDLALNYKLVITNYEDYVLRYYCYCCSDNQIIDELNYLFNKLKNLDSKWFYSEISYINYFFVCLTRIWILSYAYNYKKLDNDIIKELFFQFKENKIFYQRFYLNKLDDCLDKLESNLIIK